MREPQEFCSPRTQMLSLMATGIPASAPPFASPRRVYLFCATRRARAINLQKSVERFVNLSALSSEASVTARAVTSPFLISVTQIFCVFCQNIHYWFNFGDDEFQIRGFQLPAAEKKFSWKPSTALKNLRNAEVAGGRIGSLVERELLAERWLSGVLARGIRALAFRRQAAVAGSTRASVERVQLLDVSDDFGNLRRECTALFRGDFEVRELRDLFNVGFCDRALLS